MTLQRIILKAGLPLTVIAASVGLSGCATTGPRYVGSPENCVNAINSGRSIAYDDECGKSRQMIAALNSTASSPQDRYVVDMIVAASIDELSKTDPAQAARLLQRVQSAVPTFNYGVAITNLEANGGRAPCLAARTSSGTRFLCRLDQFP